MVERRRRGYEKLPASCLPCRAPARTRRSGPLPSSGAFHAAGEAQGDEPRAGAHLQRGRGRGAHWGQALGEGAQVGVVGPGCLTGWQRGGWAGATLCVATSSPHRLHAHSSARAYIALAYTHAPMHPLSHTPPTIYTLHNHPVPRTPASSHSTARTPRAPTWPRTLSRSSRASRACCSRQRRPTCPSTREEPRRRRSHGGAAALLATCGARAALRTGRAHRRATPRAAVTCRRRATGPGSDMLRPLRTLA